MSQSGSGPLASDEASTALPSPSPSSSDLPDLSEPSPHDPKAQIATIRGILSHNKAKGKKLTQIDFASCFNALDTLDRLLDSNDLIESSLQAFKAELLGEISAMTPKPVSYASATASASVRPSSTPSGPAPPPLISRVLGYSMFHAITTLSGHNTSISRVYIELT
ncbi:hypothetical protein C8R47DRAFT_1075483 [Mycena vitilis]|nr:hypothetical protein C8R47DRAFT_1075483 [Mycena vitilis]